RPMRSNGPGTTSLAPNSTSCSRQRGRRLTREHPLLFGRSDMTTPTRDHQLQRDVLDALAQDTKLRAGEVAVSVRDGVVTLSGIVRTYGEKCEALEVALRCRGVNAVADEVTVRVPASFGPSDSDMAEGLLRTMTEELRIPSGEVHITVQNGWVTLTGQVTR